MRYDGQYINVKRMALTSKASSAASTRATICSLSSCSASPNRSARQDRRTDAQAGDRHDPVVRLRADMSRDDISEIKSAALHQYPTRPGDGAALALDARHAQPADRADHRRAAHSALRRRNALLALPARPPNRVGHHARGPALPPRRHHDQPVSAAQLVANRRRRPLRLSAGRIDTRAASSSPPDATWTAMSSGTICNGAATSWRDLVASFKLRVARCERLNAIFRNPKSQIRNLPSTFPPPLGSVPLSGVPCFGSKLKGSVRRQFD